MKTEVYSWRLSGELKSDLERAARLRKVPASSILEQAVRDWLQRSPMESDDNEVQRQLHASAASCLGVLAGANPRRAETAREQVRKRLSRRRAR
jgi:predicted transcriptional regulator